MKIHRLLALALALSAAAVPLVTAWAKTAVSITISGPGLAGEVQVTDDTDFRALSDTGGASLSASVLPALADEFYVVRIGIGDETGQVFATTVYHYYADPQGAAGICSTLIWRAASRPQRETGFERRPHGTGRSGASFGRMA